MSTLKIGDLVDTDKGQGTIAFYGETQFSGGIWVGVILNEPKGKNNGTVKGVAYFTCPDNYGIFVTPDKVRPRMTTPRARTTSHIRAPTAIRKPSNSKISYGSTLTTPTGTPRMTPASSMEKISTMDRQKSFGTKVAQSITSQIPKMEKVAEAQVTVPKQLSQTAKSSLESNASSTPSVVKDKILKIEEKSVNSPVDTPVFKLPEVNATDMYEVDYLKREVKELTEKLDSLKKLRKAEHEKLAEFDRNLIVIRRLEEFKSEMTMAHSGLKQEKEELLKKLDELEKEKDENTDVMHLLHQLESVTLDREMAEEKSELLKSEVEALQQTIQERDDELSLLKSELESRSSELSSTVAGDVGGDVINTLQLKQLQQENSRLREAIMKVRDAFTQSAREVDDMKKELDVVQRERDELLNMCERHVAEIDNAKSTINEFREQVDAAMGSERMISTLTDTNLDLEERIRTLEEEIIELEDIKAMDEEIIESQKELEMDLKQDMERHFTVISDLRKQLNDFDKRAKDYENVISRFREKNAELNEQVQHLKDEILIIKSQEEEARLNGNNEDSFSLKVVTANRTFSEIVESELRSVELDFSRQHAIYLKSFLPDNFTKAGGDNDCVLLCILFPRMISKASSLAKLLCLKYPPVPSGLRREHITLSHKAEQWAHVKKFGYSLSALNAILKKFEFVLKNCSVERLTRLAIQQLEITGQEKNLDMYFELLRQNRLDENTSVDNLDRIVNFLQKIFATNMSTESANVKETLRDTIIQMKEGLNWNHFNCERLHYFLQPSDSDSSEFSKFVTALNSSIVECESLTIRALNRIPAENDLMLSLDVNEKIMNAIAALERSTKLIHSTCSFAASQLTTIDVDGFSSSQMKEMLHSSVEKFFGTTDSNRATAVLTDNIQILKAFLIDISERLENSSMEISPATKNTFSPVLERAHARKNDIVEAEGLRWQLSKKDEEIFKLQTLVKARERDISTFKVRLEMADNQIANSGKSDDVKVEHLRTRCEQLQADILKQNSDYERKLNELKIKLKQTIEERDREKEHGRELAKNSLVNDVHQNILNSSIMPMSPTGVSIQSVDSEILRLQKELFNAFNDLKWAEQRIRLLETQNARKLLDELEEINAPDFVCGIHSMMSKKKKTENDKELDVMMNESEQLIQESNRCLIEPFDPRERIAFRNQVANINERIDTLKFRFCRFWNRTHPGEALPKLANDLFAKGSDIEATNARLLQKDASNAKSQQRCRSILDKWNVDLKKDHKLYSNTVGR